MVSVAFRAYRDLQIRLCWPLAFLRDSRPEPWERGGLLYFPLPPISQGENKQIEETQFYLKKEQKLNYLASCYACCEIQAWILFRSNVRITVVLNIKLEEFGESDLAYVYNMCLTYMKPPSQQPHP